MPLKIPDGKSVYFHGRKLIGEIPDKVVAILPPGIKEALESRKKQKSNTSAPASKRDGQP